MSLYGSNREHDINLPRKALIEFQYSYRLDNNLEVHSMYADLFSTFRQKAVSLGTYVINLIVYNFEIFFEVEMSQVREFRLHLSHLQK